MEQLFNLLEEWLQSDYSEQDAKKQIEDAIITIHPMKEFDYRKVTIRYDNNVEDELLVKLSDKSIAHLGNSVLYTGN